MNGLRGEGKVAKNSASTVSTKPEPTHTEAIRSRSVRHALAVSKLLPSPSTRGTVHQEILPRIGTQIDQMEQGQAVEGCVACGQGDNTIGHWVRWCTVPVLALRDLTGDSMFTSLAECSRKGPKQLAIASRVVHQFRLLLREAGAMRHQTTAPLVPREVWINKLAQRVQSELPSDLRMQQTISVHRAKRCTLEESHLCCCDRPPLHIADAMTPARVCITLSAITRNQVVAVVPLGSESLQLTQQKVLQGTGISPNVTFETFICDCGDYHSHRLPQAHWNT